MQLGLGDRRAIELLGPARLRRGRQLRELCALPLDRDRAHPRRHDHCHGLHYPGDHRQAAGLPLSVVDLTLRMPSAACGPRLPPSSDGQCGSRPLGPDPRLHDLLLDLPGPVPGAAAFKDDFCFKALTSSDALLHLPLGLLRPLLLDARVGAEPVSCK